MANDTAFPSSLAVYQAAFQQSPLASIIIQPQADHGEINGQFKELFSLKSDTIKTDQFLQLFDSSDSVDIASVDRLHDSIVAEQPMDILLQTKRGLICIAATSTKLRTDLESPCYAFKFVNATSRYLQQQELQTKQNIFRLMTDNNPDLMFVKDEDFRITQANKALLSVYPKDKRDKVIGYTTVEDYDPEEAKAWLANDQRAFDEGISEVLETVAFPDGQTRILSTKKIRFEDHTGTPYILGIGRDVTERERLLQRLMESNNELERFAYVASHDMQEPIRNIGNFASLIRMRESEALTDNATEYFGHIEESAQRLRTMVHDLLEYSRLEHGQAAYEVADANLLLERTSKNLQLLIFEHNATIHSDTLPDVNCYPVQFTRLLQNLITNGIKYSDPERSPIITVRAAPVNGGHQFTIEDNGVGIDPEFAEAVFEPFRRLTTWRKTQGSGIGLSVCRRIVESHGGRIWVEPNLPHGSRFHFTILAQ